MYKKTAELRWQPTTAGLVVNELESRCAVTLKANDLILTNVRAAAIVHKALVKIWSKGTAVTFSSTFNKVKQLNLQREDVNEKS